MVEDDQGAGTVAVFGASGGIGGAMVDALITRGVHKVYAGARELHPSRSGAVVPFRFDLLEEASIAAAADAMRAAPPRIVIVATGVLSPTGSTGPEKSARAIEADAMARMFAINAIGPALIFKHFSAIMPRKPGAKFIALSARVGSIADNRLGGWHSYRASKAALNMLIRNFAIEFARTHPDGVVAGIHPGTVNTALSRPFQANLPDGQLQGPATAVQRILTVIDSLKPAHSGHVFDWQGERIEP